MLLRQERWKSLGCRATWANACDAAWKAEADYKTSPAKITWDSVSSFIKMGSWAGLENGSEPKLYSPGFYRPHHFLEWSRANYHSGVFTEWPLHASFMLKVLACSLQSHMLRGRYHCSLHFIDEREVTAHGPIAKKRPSQNLSPASLTLSHSLAYRRRSLNINLLTTHLTVCWLAWWSPPSVHPSHLLQARTQLQPSTNAGWESQDGQMQMPPAGRVEKSPHPPTHILLRMPENPLLELHFSGANLHWNRLLMSSSTNCTM